MDMRSRRATGILTVRLIPSQALLPPTQRPFKLVKRITLSTLAYKPLSCSTSKKILAVYSDGLLGAVIAGVNLLFVFRDTTPCDVARLSGSDFWNVQGVTQTW